MRKLRLRIGALVSAAALALSLTACGAAKAETLDIFAMDTYMSLVAVGSGGYDALQTAAVEINRLEALLSRTKDGSDVSRLNASAGGEGVTLSGETAALLALAKDCADRTAGAFDVTVAPLVDAWGITTDTPRVPAQSEIEALLTLVGGEHLTVDDSALHSSQLPPEDVAAALDAGCAVDLGGIAKGYASDRVADIFEKYQLTGGTVSLGGNVYVCGTTGEGKPWNVAIQDPNDSDGFAVRLRLSDAFVVTSGGYQRYFTAPDGTVYQHIIDPATGYPARSDLVSVSIVTYRAGGDRQGTMADAYSTALYVMGEAGAAAFWQAHRSDFDMVLITGDGRLLYTPGLADTIETDGSAYACQVIA